MTTTTLTRSNSTIYIKPFTEYAQDSHYNLDEQWVEIPAGVSIQETYDYYYTYRDSEGCTYTDIESFSWELTTQEIENLWGYFICERNCVEPIDVDIAYPQCHFPAHSLYESGLLEF